MDLASLYEIFVQEEYSLQLRNARFILDLGAHWGDSAIYFALKYPNAKVFALEPNPSSFTRLQNLAKDIPNIIPIQAALGSRSGEVDFFVSPNSLGNGTQRRSTSDESISVESLSLKDICERCNVHKFDLIKFDIEGGESVLFENMTNAQRADAFIGELHYDLTSLSEHQVRNFFSNFKFNQRFISQNRSIMTALPLSFGEVEE